jgi:aryl-alcohol dehydrogenase-like predicted oxidoreductase
MVSAVLEIQAHGCGKQEGAQQQDEGNARHHARETYGPAKSVLLRHISIFAGFTMGPMRYRRLGRTGMEVSEIGYGAWGIGGGQWRGGTDEESIRALRRAFELGLNFIDTALAYGNGHSERLVGAVVKDAPQRVFVATKVPPKNRIWPAAPGSRIADVFPYEYIVSSTEESLRNTGLETLDLQQLHVWDPGWMARDEWKRAFEDLRKAGKIRFVGISINDHQPDTALEVVGSGLIDTVQVIYNIFDQTPERNLFEAVRKQDVGVLARVPLDEGSLTGTITENTSFEGDEFRAFYFKGDRKRQVVERVRALEADLTDVPGSLPEKALRFCLSQPAVSTVIPGMRRVSTVESSCRVSDTGPLPPHVVERLRKHAWNKNFYD